MSSQYIDLPLSGVTTVNGFDGAVTIAAGTNITIVNSAGTITISSSGGGGGITALTGDVTASGSGSVVATLATVNSDVGSYTYASITVNAKGLVTAASSGTAPTTYTFADSLINSAGTVTLVNDSASPSASAYYGTDASSVLGYHALPVSGINQLTGDVTAGPGTGSQVATLATVNSDVGSYTYASITVNAKGLITAASSGSAPTNYWTEASGTLYPTTTSDRLLLGGATDDGISTLQVNGQSYLDSGYIYTDGDGNLNINSLIALSSFSTDDYQIYSNGGGSLTITSMLTVNGSSSLDDGQIYTDGAGNLTVNGTTGIYVPNGNLEAGQDLAVSNEISGSYLFVDYINASYAVDNSNTETIDFYDRYLLNSSNIGTLDWQNLYLYDSLGDVSVDWGNRILWDTTGSIQAAAWANGAMVLPDYTTITSPIVGMVAYNYTTLLLTSYNGTSWV